MISEQEIPSAGILIIDAQKSNILLRGKMLLDLHMHGMDSF
jgi:hypothetical protein